MLCSPFVCLKERDGERKEKGKKEEEKKRDFSQGVNFFIHSVKILLSTYCVPGIVLSAQEYLRHQEGP